MKVLKKSFFRIALVLLLAILTVILCVFGGGYSAKNVIAETEEVPVNVTFKEVSFQNTVYPGESYIVRITVNIGVVGNWNSLSLNIVPLQSDGVSVDSVLSTYFEMGEVTFNLPFEESNLVLLNDDEFAQGAGAKVSFFYSGEPVSTSDNLVISLKLTVKDMPEDISSVQFGVAPLKSNFVAVKTDSGVYKYQADQKVYIGTKLDDSFTGDCIAFNTLKYNICHSQAMIHLAADKTELTAGETFILTVDISVKRTDLKWDMFYFELVPLDEENNTITNWISYFEFVSRKTNGNIPMGNSNLGITALYMAGLFSSRQFSVNITIKIKEDAPTMQSLKYGVSNRTNCKIVLRNDATNDTYSYLANNPEQITTNTIPMSIKAA